MATFFRTSGTGASTRPAGSDERAPLPERQRRWWFPLLSDGVRPLFLAGDIAACLVAWFIVPAPRVLELAYAALLIPMLSQVGLYRSRLALSILDDFPRLFKRWLLALAVVLVCTGLVSGHAIG